MWYHLPLPQASLATRNLEFNKRLKYNFLPHPVSSLPYTLTPPSIPNATAPLIPFSWPQISFYLCSSEQLQLTG